MHAAQRPPSTEARAHCTALHTARLFRAGLAARSEHEARAAQPRREYSGYWRNARRLLSEQVLQYYGAALSLGHKNIFHALPRMLTLWFDFGTALARAQSSGGLATAAPASASTKRSVPSQVQEQMTAIVARLPPYVWLTVPPSHPLRSAASVLQLVVTRSLMWNTMPCGIPLLQLAAVALSRT